MNASSTALLLAATLGVPLAFLIACIVRPVRRVMPWLLGLAPLPGIAAALWAVDGEALTLGSHAVRLTFALDVPGAILLGVAALLWTAAGAYSSTYLREARNASRFAICWLMALTGCLGVFVAADLVSLYALLALLTLGAFGLVIHDETPRAWRAGAIYFGLALLAESVLLVALVMLAAEIPGDSLLIRDATAALPGSAQRDLILALLVAGLGLKAGLVPLHVWMPLAHAAAPVPASSVLSGAVVKVGIIGLIRFLPLGTALPDWGIGLAVAGFVTAFYGVAVGITQQHPKAVLAYSSVSQMGVVVAVIGMGLASGDAGAGISAAFYAAHHVLVKGALFLAVGVMASTALARRWAVVLPAVVLCLSLGGLPLTGGAIAKFVVKDQLEVGLVAWLAIASAAGTTLLMLHFLHRLVATAPGDARATAPAGLTWPWLAMATCAVVIPWLLYSLVGFGRASVTLAPQVMWAAAWPVGVGALLALALRRWGSGLPRIPEGDLAVGIDSAGRSAVRAGMRFARLDGALREWPTATLCLLALTIVFGLFLLRG